jgi:nitrite reductase (cytochrome c-552)
MALRITRPAFIEGIRALKAAQGEPDYAVNERASRQEMRAYVCGQCHVEYYFRGPEKRLVYPWSNGLRVDSILAYYDSVGHRDGVHALSGAPVLKAQHPEFEMWNQGVHARAGVTCADCHMPYVRVGAHKISDHHVRSPLLNIARACQTCHPVGPRGADSGEYVPAAGPGARGGHGPDRGRGAGARRGRERCGTCAGARFSAPRAVLSRLYRS